MIVRLYHRRGNAGQHIGKMFHLEMLRQRVYQTDDHRHFLSRIETRLRRQAVVTSTTVVLSIIFTEIAQQQLPAAVPRLCVGLDFHEQLTSDFLLGHRFAHQELVQLADILITVICYADTFPAVSTGPSGLLIIPFQASRHVVMDDEPHIRLVNTHSECDGGHNHVHLLHQELVLVLRPHFRIQAGVVRHGTDTIDHKHLGQLLHLLAAQTIYDARLSGMLLYILDDVLVLVYLVAHFIVEIRPVERGLEHMRVHNPQVLQDVVLHLRSGCRRQCNDRGPADFVHDRTDLPVFRPEVMPPVRDAVRLVHSEERYADLSQDSDVLLLRKALRRHIQQLGHSGSKILRNLSNLGFCQ